MPIRAKSVVFYRDGEYAVFSNVYEAEYTSEPAHIDLVSQAMRRGFTDRDFIAACTSTWNPYTIEIYPDLEERAQKRIKRLVKSDIQMRFNDKRLQKLLDINRKEK